MDSEPDTLMATTVQPLEELHPAGLVLFHPLVIAENSPVVVFIYGYCNQNADVFKLAAPVAAQANAIHVDVGYLWHRKKINPNPKKQLKNTCYSAIIKTGSIFMNCTSGGIYMNCTQLRLYPSNFGNLL